MVEKREEQLSLLESVTQIREMMFLPEQTLNATRRALAKQMRAPHSDRGVAFS